MPSGLPSEKEEFPPLLEIGRHVMSMEQLRDLCVEAFPLSITRQVIYNGFSAIVDQLASVAIVGQLWIDGSFLTEKIDPEDVDVVLRLSGIVADNLNEEQHEILEFLDGSDVRDSYNCHIFTTFYWPEDHPLYWKGEYDDVYWMKQWGFSRDDTLKGVAVVELTENNA